MHHDSFSSKLVPEVVKIIEDNRTFYDVTKSLNDLLNETEVFTAFSNEYLGPTIPTLLNFLDAV